MSEAEVIDVFREAGAILDGHFILTSGLRSPVFLQKARVLIVEDIVTTGLSSRETVAAVQALGAEVLAEACLIDRSGGEADVGVPLIALARYRVPAYPPDQLPPALAAIPAVKPGSRGLA